MLSMMRSTMTNRKYPMIGASMPTLLMRKDRRRRWRIGMAILWISGFRSSGWKTLGVVGGGRWDGPGGFQALCWV